MLNKQKGNMYPFVTHTWNPIKGECPHDCHYCYMKVYKQKPTHLVEKELEDDLGEGNYIFVGSSVDMFADVIPYEWIMKVLAVCRKFNKNTYLFQSKNPGRFNEFIMQFPLDTYLGTTIETNRIYSETNAPSTLDRAMALQKFLGFKRMVSIEPIMDFDLEEMVSLIKMVNPAFVSIGADSKGHHLKEPSYEKIKQLIGRLQEFTEVREKSNLKRLIK